MGYLRLPSFAQDMKLWEEGGRNPISLQAALETKKTALREAFADLMVARAMILDLRGNGGGSDALGHFLATSSVTPRLILFTTRSLPAHRKTFWHCRSLLAQDHVASVGSTNALRLNCSPKKGSDDTMATWRCSWTKAASVLAIVF